MRLVDKPRKEALITRLRVKPFRYASKCDIVVLFTHVDEILLTPRLVEYRYRGLAGSLLQSVSQLFDLRETNKSIYVKLEEKLYIVAVYELRILVHVSNPINIAIASDERERAAIEQEAPGVWN